MKVKKLPIVISLFLLVWVFGAISTLSQNGVIIKFKDNTEKTALFSSLSKLTFSNGNIVLNITDGEDDFYTLSSVRKIIFSNTSQTEQLPLDNLKLILYPNPASGYIQLKNIPDGMHSVMIYRLDGAVVYSGTLSAIDNQIDLGELPKGFYVLKMNDNALKFVKQ